MATLAEEQVPARTADGRTRRQRCLAIKQSLFTERSFMDAYWSELAQWVKPTRPRFLGSERNQVARRNQQIIDGTAGFALRTLQSGLHSGLTSPARQWFKLTTPDPSVAGRLAVKQWLHDVSTRINQVLQRSNIYNVLPVVYGDIGLFSTAAMGVFADDEDGLRAYSYPIGSYAFSVDHKGRVSTFAREYELSVEMVIAQFGGANGRELQEGETIQRGNFSSWVLNAWDRGNYTQGVPIVWIVERNRGYDVRRLDGKQWKFSSYYFEGPKQGNGLGQEASGMLRESGFRTAAIFCPRWDVTGEDTYGTDGPGMTALGDAKQIQIQEKTKGRAIQKMVDPPLLAPHELRNQKVSLLPADITYQDMRSSHDGLRPIHETNYPVAPLMEDQQLTRARIRESFMADIFLMLSQDDNRGSQPLTAAEVSERHEEKLVLLGPVLERTNDELLDPLIDRVFSLIADAGGIPDAPEELLGSDLGVEYTSILAQAQKLIGSVGQDRLLSSIVGMTQVWPEARFKLKPFVAIDEYADQFGVNPAMIASDDEAQAMADAEQQQRAQAQQAQMQESAAKSAQALGNTDMTQDSALSRVLGQ